MTLRRTRLNLECLEAREVPATLVDPNTLTYQDKDGNDVTVQFSNAILTQQNVNSIFQFDSGANAVNGIIKADGRRPRAAGFLRRHYP